MTDIDLLVLSLKKLKESEQHNGEIFVKALKALRESSESEEIKCKAELMFWNKILPYL